jgi:ABC-type spermidine/putrescine transport system permease subunit II
MSINVKVRNRVFRLSGGIVCTIVGAFMAVPAATVVVMSFAGGANLVFPPTSWGFQQYHTAFTNGVWIPAISESLKIGIPVSVLAVAVGLPAALALQRSRLPMSGLVRLFGVAPLVVPAVAYAVAMYGFMAQIGIIGSYWGLVFADCMLVIPFVVIVIESSLSRIPRDLELVAMTLGASRSRAIVGITLRLLLPAIAASFLLCFITNFDEAVFVNFLSGPGVTTLPKAIFNSLRTGLDPSITAVATVLMVISSALVAGVWALRTSRSTS